MSQIIAPPTSKSAIERYALQVRHQLGVDNEFKLPVISIIEERIPWLLDPTFNYEYASKEELPLEYAHYNPKANLLTIREDVYDRAYAGEARDRFTIAHEIGHFCLHSNDMVFSRATHGQRIPSYQDPEWQANTFASYFMMPQHFIQGKTAEEIAFLCGTSYQAASIALKR